MNQCACACYSYLRFLTAKNTVRGLLGGFGVLLVFWCGAARLGCPCGMSQFPHQPSTQPPPSATKLDVLSVHSDGLVCRQTVLVALVCCWIAVGVLVMCCMSIVTLWHVIDPPTATHTAATLCEPRCMCYSFLLCKFLLADITWSRSFCLLSVFGAVLCRSD